MEKHYSFLKDTGIKFQITVHEHPVWVKAWYLDPEIFKTAPLKFLFCHKQIFFGSIIVGGRNDLSTKIIYCELLFLSTSSNTDLADFAEQHHLSPNYFGALIKKETGKSAQEYIQDKIIDVAKNKIFDSNKNISEIAYELGFKYPQHFTRFFKQYVGNTPNEYKVLN